MNPSISVIIACYNSEKVIEKTLECLQNQVFKSKIDWEVILVDNMSTDDTATLAKRQWDKNPITDLQIIKEPNLGEANARKTGFLMAKYDILNIVDDDNRVPENWVETISGFYFDQTIGLVGCVGVGDFEETPPSWFEKHQHAFAIGSLYEGDFVNITNDALVPGAGLSFRRKIYTSLINNNWKPFLIGRVGNKQSAGADSELCFITRHLGYKIYYSNTLKFKHFTAKNRITWDRLERMFEGFGDADMYVLAYRNHFEEQSKGKSLKTFLQKIWWVNYLNKKTSNLLKYNNTGGDYSTSKLMKIRNDAFCKSITLNKKRFIGAFKYLEEIKNIKIE